MLKLTTFLLSVFLIGLGAAQDPCLSCIVTGKEFCADTNTCDVASCTTKITVAINCPSLPNATFAYDDNVARTQWMPLFGAGAADAKHAKICFERNWPTMQFSRHIHVNCSDRSKNLPETTCSMITAFDTTKKILVMSFRGTDSLFELGEEFLNYFKGRKKFFDSGYIFEFFYDAYLAVWQGGLEAEMRSLKYKYPDYEVWVTGHSLGGALASVGASWLVKAGLFPGSKVKLLTVGQPRTGDLDYATWHQNTFAYSYRIVHSHDVVPHLPFQYELNEDEMYHHRTEIWYNNNMAVGSPYNVCKEADGPYCSNTQKDTNSEDHLFYYGRDLVTYGFMGCPK